MTTSQLRREHAEVYELERGGWLVKTRAGRWLALDADGRQVPA